jgi:hypothetical protein
VRLRSLSDLSSGVFAGKTGDRFAYVAFFGNLAIWWDGVEVRLALLSNHDEIGPRAAAREPVFD